MFFSSIKRIDRLLKEINKLLCKGMSNIYLKGTIKKIVVLKTLIFKV